MKVIKQFVTHQKPHFDELVSRFVIDCFGWKFFDLKGAVWAEMSHNEMPGGWKAHPQCLFVGCAGSPYDEHGKGAESSAILVAEDILSIRDLNILDRLLSLVGQYDRNLVPVRDGLPSVTKALFEQGKTAEEVYNWVKSFLKLVYTSEKDLYEKIDREVDALGLLSDELVVAEKFLRNKKTFRVWNQLAFTDCCKFVGDPAWEKFGRDALAAKQARFNEALALVKASQSHTFQSVVGRLSIVGVDSDNDQCGPASRSCKHDICVVRNTAGNVQIMSSNKKNICLYKAAAHLRILEREANGKTKKLPMKYLMSEGTIPECPEWHVHEGINGAQLYNGTRSYTAVAPTKLSLAEIVDIIIDSLTPSSMQNADRGLGDGSLAKAFG